MKIELNVIFKSFMVHTIWPTIINNVRSNSFVKNVHLNQSYIKNQNMITNMTANVLISAKIKNRPIDMNNLPTIRL